MILGHLMPTAGGGGDRLRVQSPNNAHRASLPVGCTGNAKNDTSTHPPGILYAYFLQTYNKYICTAGVAFDVLCENEESISGKFATNIK